MQTRTSKLYILYMLMFTLSVVAAISTIVWSLNNSIEDHEANELKSLTVCVDALGGSLQTLIKHQNNMLHQYVKNNIDTVSQFADDYNNAELLRAVKDQLSGYFPDIYAIHITDGAGRGGPDSFGEFVGAQCLRDVEKFRKTINTSSPKHSLKAS